MGISIDPMMIWIPLVIAFFAVLSQWVAEHAIRRASKGTYVSQDTPFSLEAGDHCVGWDTKSYTFTSNKHFGVYLFQENLEHGAIRQHDGKYVLEFPKVAGQPSDVLISFADGRVDVTASSAVKVYRVQAMNQMAQSLFGLGALSTLGILLVTIVTLAS